MNDFMGDSDYKPNEFELYVFEHGCDRVLPSILKEMERHPFLTYQGSKEAQERLAGVSMDHPDFSQKMADAEKIFWSKDSSNFK